MPLASECPYRDARICTINKKLQSYTDGHSVIYEELQTGEIKSMAEAEWVPGGTDIIRLASSESNNTNDLTFLIAHEFGHSYLRHGRREIEARASLSERKLTDEELFSIYGDIHDSPLELYHQQELEADKFAIEFMRSEHKNPLFAMQRVLANSYGSYTHPSKSVRLEQARALQTIIVK